MVRQIPIHPPMLQLPHRASHGSRLPAKSSFRKHRGNDGKTRKNVEKNHGGSPGSNRWRHVSTIFLAIFGGNIMEYSLKFRPKK